MFADTNLASQIETYRANIYIRPAWPFHKSAGSAANDFKQSVDIQSKRDGPRRLPH